MILLQSSVETRHPRWDGSRILFNVLIAGEQVPCAISRMALEDIADRRVDGTAELLGCFDTARECIEAIALEKLRARSDGVQAD